MIRVAVVDDHPIMRFGISALIDSQPDMMVAAQGGTADEAIKLFASIAPDIMLIDLQLPDRSGTHVIEEVCSQHPEARFVVLTTYAGDDDIYQCVRAGVSGYLVKGMSYEVLTTALREVYKGKRYLPRELAHKLRDRTPDAELSAREQQVLELIAQGHSNRSIAEQLGLTEGTVKCHVGAILSRLQVNDRTQALITAVRRGMVRL